MRLAVDWDGTWTEDPEFWSQVVRLARARGHEAWCVTAREGRAFEEVLEAVSPVLGRAFCVSAGRLPKAEALARAAGPGPAVVWIDDAPETIRPIARRESGLILPEPPPAGPPPAEADGEIVVHVDGSCLGNPGPGGWGALIDGLAGGRVELQGFEPVSTNNRMELAAAIAALEAAPPGARLQVRTDSRYLVDGMTSWLPNWRKRNWTSSTGTPVANRDLWERLATLAEARRASWTWVRGHSGDPGNERAHALAEAAMRRAAEDGPASA